MNQSPKFLESVARYYLDKSGDHRDTVLLFPNKRAIIFMRRYFRRNAKNAVFLPKMRTLGAFLASHTELVEASRIDRLFTLYDAYCEVIYERGTDQKPLPFDKFRYRGEMLLDDFDDVDRQMADVSELFTNMKRLEEIQTDFLDEDQRAVARELWGYEPEEYEGFKNNRRRHGEGDVVYEGFLRLSELLEPIYRRFHELLRNQGYITRGMIVRSAAENIDRWIDTDGKIPQCIGFVGFGILSRAERDIFKKLRNQRRAEFFWDVPDMLVRDLPEGMNNFATPLSKYIDRLVKYFPMPRDYVAPTAECVPEVEIIAVPANTFQAKIAGNILNILDEKGLLKARRVDNTAVILPDASLLTPLLHSVSVSPINVTMGIPIRHTPFATLLSLIIRLNMNSRPDKDDVLYLTDNVRQIINHPSLGMLLPDQTAKLADYLDRKGRFMTSFSTICEQTPDLAFVFTPVGKDGTASSAKVFLDTLIDNLTDLIEKNDKSRENAELHEFRILKAMRAAIDNLIGVIEKHPRFLHTRELGSLSFFLLVERQLRTEQLNFDGSPLTGVQVMGALESRSLDFDNVIMLSMNEKTFPPRNFMKSVLPGAIRNAFGLSTTEERELEYAWIYANLVSRCQRAYLVYDASSENSGRGGMSRYLYQTRYIFNNNDPKFISIPPAGRTNPPVPIKVKKTREIMKKLDRFKAGGNSYLSVSSVEKYGECPLKFYLSRVERIQEPKETEPHINDAVQGSIVHEILENTYNDILEKRDGLVDSTFSVEYEDIERKMTELLNDNWYFGHYSDIGSMPQEAQTQIRYWSERICRIIAAETTVRQPYHVYHCEMSPKDVIAQDSIDVEIKPGLTVKFTFLIDRVDRLDSGDLRFVDYKTGSDKLTVADMDSLFWQHERENEDSQPERPKDYANKAMFQLAAYSFLFKQLMKTAGKPFKGKIEIEITQVQFPEKSIGTKLTIGADEINHSEDEPLKEFEERFRNMIASIFDPKVPFTQTNNPYYCQYCQFKTICHNE